MKSIRLAVICATINVALAQTITSGPGRPRPTGSRARRSIARFNEVHRNLNARALPAGAEDCDGQGVLFCPSQSGTCFTDNGYIGCCTESSCAARTKCYEFGDERGATCDPDKGGCTACTNSNQPSCVTFINALEDQSALYCDVSGATITTEYLNLVTSGTKKSSSATTTRSSTTSTTTSRDKSSGDNSGTVSSGDSAGKEQKSSSNGLSTGAVAGIAVGATLIGVAIIAALLWFFCLKKRARGDSTSEAYQAVGQTSPVPSSNAAVLASQDLKAAPDYYAGKAELDGSQEKTSKTDSLSPNGFLAPSPNVSEMEAASPHTGSQTSPLLHNRVSSIAGLSELAGDFSHQASPATNTTSSSTADASAYPGQPSWGHGRSASSTQLPPQQSVERAGLGIRDGQPAAPQPGTYSAYCPPSATTGAGSQGVSGEGTGGPRTRRVPVGRNST